MHVRKGDRGVDAKAAARKKRGERGARCSGGGRVPSCGRVPKSAARALGPGSSPDRLRLRDAPECSADLNQRPVWIARFQPVADHGDEIGTDGGVRQEVGVPEGAGVFVDLDQVGEVPGIGPERFRLGPLRFSCPRRSRLPKILLATSRAWSEGEE